MVPLKPRELLKRTHPLSLACLEITSPTSLKRVPGFTSAMAFHKHCTMQCPLMCDQWNMQCRAMTDDSHRRLFSSRLHVASK